MRARLAALITSVALICGALGVISPIASAAKPDLCEKAGCGGKGAQEYSEKYASEGREFGGANEMRFHQHQRLHEKHPVRRSVGLLGHRLG